jgi:N utilization substance protein B
MSPDGQNQNISGKNTRREARELALRMLYQIELGHQPPDEVIEAAFAQSQLDGKNRTFADEVVRGTIEHQKEIDSRLSELAVEWATERQAVVDRNILRLAAYEMLYRPDSPVAAVVNEAVELAKKYSTSESGRFVNGVLGALARQPRGDAQDTGSDEESDSDQPDLD